MADLIIHGGAIITMDHDTANAEAIAIKQGRIIAVGCEEDVFKQAGVNTCYVELLSYQTVVPGFIEPHQHAIQQALTKCLYVECGGYYYHSYEEIKTLFRSTLAKLEDNNNKANKVISSSSCDVSKDTTQQWCIFFGWDPELLPDLPKLNLEILDSYSETIPIVVIGQSGHVGWVNSKAFELARITDDVIDPVGGSFVRDPVTGKLTGQLLEVPPLRMVIPLQPPGMTADNLVAAFNKQWKEYACAGFTTVTDLLYMPNPLLDQLFIAKSQSSDCPIRLALYQKDEPRLNEVHDFPENDKLWIAGVKLIGDGSPHCGTAATREPYNSSELTDILAFPPAPNCGKLNHTRDYLLERLRYWHAKGVQVAVHTHGERAIDQSLDVIEEVLLSESDKDLRHRLEHLGLCDEAHVKKAANLGISLSFFVQHLYFYATSYKDHIFGAERTNRWAPLSLAVKYNALWTLHQDHPTFPGPPEPFANLMTAVTRTERYNPGIVYGPQYCITMAEALKGYTINAAKQLHKEKELGSLTVGKRADLVILSDNPLKVDPAKLLDIQVLDTYLDGRSNKLTERKETTKDGKVVYCYKSKLHNRNVPSS